MSSSISDLDEKGNPRLFFFKSARAEGTRGSPEPTLSRDSPRGPSGARRRPYEPITQITFAGKLVNSFSRAALGLALEATPLPNHRSAHVFFTIYYVADDALTHVSSRVFIHSFTHADAREARSVAGVARASRRSCCASVRRRDIAARRSR